MATSMAAKMWKERPPGPEQKELERMFKSNEIDARELPDNVKRRNELFKDYSATVFANHFRKTKAKLGLSAAVAESSNDGDGRLSILELGGFVPNERSRTPPDLFSRRLESAQTVQNVTHAAHSNAPCWTWIYTDHEKKKDFVCVTMPALCGKNAKFTISEDGTQIKIKYDWPDIMFKGNKLFEKSTLANGRKLPMSHPKVHAFTSHLLESGVTENSTLQADITIDLPKQVLRENDTWSLEKVLVDNQKMIILEFTAYQKALIINDADTSLDF